jgi:tetraacyldisaccharide 4'-kinase
MDSFRRLLYPFSLLYGLAVWVRNRMFDAGYLKSTSFSVRIIGVGNLSVGGTGKTPHIEYLIRLLKSSSQVVTLSRGYGRKTKGFILASGAASSSTIGDEPMQYFTKFSDVRVSVGENRKEAIDEIIRQEPGTDVILMDDNYQHRQVKAGLQILLLNYEALKLNNLLLPAGNLREPYSSIRRADIVIVSKTPNILVPIERKRILDEIGTEPGQPVYFTFYRYGEFIRLHGQSEGMMMMGANYYLEKRFTILLVTGIANPSGLVEHLRRKTDKLETISYPDHHQYTAKDMEKIRELFDLIPNNNKIIVTTEKDAMRFRHPEIESLTRKLPFFYVPIEVEFHQDRDKFNQQILSYVQSGKTDA